MWYFASDLYPVYLSGKSDHRQTSSHTCFEYCSKLHFPNVIFCALQCCWFELWFPGIQPDWLHSIWSLQCGHVLDSWSYGKPRLYIPSMWACTGFLKLWWAMVIYTLNVGMYWIPQVMVSQGYTFNVGMYWIPQVMVSQGYVLFSRSLLFLSI